MAKIDSGHFQIKCGVAPPSNEHMGPGVVCSLNAWHSGPHRANAGPFITMCVWSDK